MDTNESSSAAMDQAQLIQQMRWRCRRGILEVELLLQPFFERHAAELVTSRRSVFENLLASNDTDLMQWLTEGGMPEDAELAQMIQEIIAEAREGLS